MTHCLSFLWVFSTLVVATISVDEGRLSKCIEYHCKGPDSYYKALGCKPVYRNEDDCCPWRYDCDHLHDLTYRNKCLLYYAIHEYKIGEKIKEEDAHLCEKNCICTNNTRNGFAGFNCTRRREMCPLYRPSRNGCYKGQFIQCCPDANTCQPTRSGCRRLGKTYVVGDYILPDDDPSLICKCVKIREDIYSFTCMDLNDEFDENPELAFNRNCAPVYSSKKVNNRTLVDTTIRVTWKCQNAYDEIIPVTHPVKKSIPIWDAGKYKPLSAVHCPHPDQKEYSDYIFRDGGCLLINPHIYPQEVSYGLLYRNVCRFGRLTMYFADIIKPTEYGYNSFIECRCWVPPVPTCVILPVNSTGRRIMQENPFLLQDIADELI